MKLEVAKLLVAQDDDKMNLNEGYSGRGMFGRTTAAVSFDHFSTLPGSTLSS
jgi:hypothetical protein